MRISAIQTVNYNLKAIKNNVRNDIPKDKDSVAIQPSFKGKIGAGVGSGLGTAAVAWLGAGALLAAGPLAIAAGLLCGCLGGAAIGHTAEEIVDEIDKNK